MKNKKLQCSFCGRIRDYEKEKCECGSQAASIIDEKMKTQNTILEMLKKSAVVTFEYQIEKRLYNTALKMVREGKLKIVNEFGGEFKGKNCFGKTFSLNQ